MASSVAAYVSRPLPPTGPGAIAASLPMMSAVNGPPSSSSSSCSAATASSVTLSSMPSPLVTTTGGSGGGGKDSRWLTLEVCREHVRRRCTRSDDECRFAHPPAHVEVQNGRVVCCFDSIKVITFLNCCCSYSYIFQYTCTMCGSSNYKAMENYQIRTVIY